MGLPMVWPRHSAAEDFGVIRFKALPSAAAVATLATTQFGVDQLAAQFHAGGKAIDQGHQCFAVRFAGGEIA